MLSLSHCISSANGQNEPHLPGMSGARWGRSRPCVFAVSLSVAEGRPGRVHELRVWTSKDARGRAVPATTGGFPARQTWLAARPVTLGSFMAS